MCDEIKWEKAIYEYGTLTPDLERLHERVPWHPYQKASWIDNAKENEYGTYRHPKQPVQIAAAFASYDIVAALPVKKQREQKS